MNVEGSSSGGAVVRFDTLDGTPITDNNHNSENTTEEGSSSTSSASNENGKGKEPEEEGEDDREEEVVGVPPPGGAAEEKAKIKEVFWEEKDLKIGEEWYLLPSRWIRSWKYYVGWKHEPEGDRPGKIDNHGLLMEGTRTLRGLLSEGSDYDTISSECWQLFLSWYGGGPEIKRRVVKMNGEPGVEVVPLRLCIACTNNISKESWIEFSKHATVGEFKKFAQKFYKLEPKTFRVWDWHQKRHTQTLDDDKETLQSANIINNQYVLIEVKKNGVWTLQSMSFNTYARYNVPTQPGLTGLINLGNTCFMNSSLQCLSNSVPLTNFFLTGNYKQDLNEKNPLGTNGDLAEEFFGLLKQTWGGSNSAVAPSDLKRVIGKFAPQFSGYNQHDSQELLGFLLDRLHEDINRVKVKPYVETQESNGRPDPVVAAEQWAAYKKRNDSMIVDYFQGQLKSELVCPTCNKVSVTFDPVMYLSLPLPIEKNRSLEILVYWWDSSKLPTSYKLSVPKDGSVVQIKKELEKVTGIKESTIQIKEIYNHYVYKDFIASDSISRITDRDILVAYEVPELESFKVVVTEEELERRRKRKQDRIDERNRKKAHREAQRQARLRAKEEKRLARQRARQAASAAQEGEEGPEQANPSADDEQDQNQHQSRHHTHYSQQQLSSDDDDDDDDDDDESENKQEMSDEDEEEGKYVYQKVYLARNEHQQYRSYGGMNSYSRRILLGIPFIVAIPKNINYKDLYVLLFDKIKKYLPEYYTTPVVHSAEPEPQATTQSEESSAMDVDTPAGRTEEENESSEGDNADRAVSGEDDTSSDDEMGTFGSHRSNQANRSSQANKPNKPQPAAPDARLRPMVPGLPVAFIIDPCDRQGSEFKTFGHRASQPVTFSNDGNPLNTSEHILIVFGLSNKEEENDDEESNRGSNNNEEIDPKAFERRTKDASLDAEEAGSGADKMTLANCFELFTQKETLGEDNPWYCNRCKEHKQATKKFDLWALPRILVVHLKRFSFESSGRREKIETFIDFDIDELDLTKYIHSEEQRNAGCGKYRLYAVSNHYGGLGGGHYTAYGYNHRENGWYKYDDSSVSPVSKESIKTSAAYVLFYRRKEEAEEEWKALSSEEAEVKGRTTKEVEEDDEDGENGKEANIMETDNSEEEEKGGASGS